MQNTDNYSDTISLKVVGVDKTWYSGSVKAVSSFNETGKFDILPYHAPFISIIFKELIIYEVDGQVKNFPIEKAVLKVDENKIIVFLGIKSV
jgi:F0F1-type ATP synthase epsilon subunit